MLWTFRSVYRLTALAWLTALPGTALASLPPTAAATLRLETNQLTLSLTPPLHRAERRCSLLGRIIEKLGDTSAAHALRHTFKAHVCSADMRGPAANALPAAAALALSDAPGQITRRSEDWELRCGSSHRTERPPCAAVLSPPSAVVHMSIRVLFSIAWVAGQETVVWRILAEPASGEVSSAAPAQAGNCTVSEHGRRLEATTLATLAGCLIEPTADVAARLARQLADGIPGTFEVRRGAAITEVQISPHGFAFALRELSRLANGSRKPLAEHQ